MKNNTVLDVATKEKNASLKANFVKEWTPAQFKAMKAAISRHFSNKEVSTRHGNYPGMYLTFKACDERFGLAYTSSSAYAGFWVCNTEIYSAKYPGYNYTGFALSTDQKPYAILWDKDENEIITPI
jgi:hypothetical protein